MATRLIINATILNQPRLTGLGVYAVGLLPALLRLCAADDRFSEILVAGQPELLQERLTAVTNNPRIQVREINTTHPIRRLYDLDRLIVAQRRRPEQVLFYSPTHHGVIRGGIRQVITIHDLFARLFPDNYRQQYRYFRWYLPRILAQTNRVMVDSVNTGEDLRRFYPESPPTEVVHAALRSDLMTAQPQSLPALQGRRYFLFVGPTFPYKNCERLIDAFAIFRSKSEAMLVLAGGRDEYLRELRRHVAEHHSTIAGEILFVDYPSTGELLWLYRHASALMLTTLYEGFGLPALEAMACGCPVVASGAGSLIEVCGDAAAMVDPRDINNIAETMGLMISNDRLRQRLIEAGRQNVKRFNWEISAAKVYTSLATLTDGVDPGEER